jgi:hypothetical protein
MIRLRNPLIVLVLVAGSLVAAPAAPAAAAPAHYGGTLADGSSWIADVPAGWNGTIILYSHGFGPLIAQDAPDPATQQALLGLGYALVGSSYAGASWWALKSAVDDQFGALQALEALTGRPQRTIAWGTSMGGLISALEAERSDGPIDGSLTTCGLVAGALNLNNYQLDAEYALSRLLAPGVSIKLVNYASPADAGAAAATLTGVVSAAQLTATGRARTALGAALMGAPTWFTGAAPPARTDYDAQEAQQAAELTSFVLGFVMFGRFMIEQSAGGNSSFNAGISYQHLLRRSDQLSEVQALYREAGLDLNADLAALTSDASVYADPAAVASLAQTSTPTGRLQVPELDIHTIWDQLIPVEQENWYAAQVRHAGAAPNLRQAYVYATGHCNFQPAGTIAALHVLEHRIDTGHWDGGTEPDRLNAAAAAAGLGAAAPYVPFRPRQLTGARLAPEQ